ncbi:MAG: hypothetical protein JXM70_28580 [Pirellulales bacterium]|nr:hypothetical protein [Pirellulales bacterium]
MPELNLSVSKGWIAQRLDVCFDREYYFNPERRYEIDARCAEYVERKLGDLGACFTESNLGRREFIRPDQVLIGGIQPNMILGMLLGAEFVPGMDKDADITPECFAGRPLDELPPPTALVDHPLIRQFDEQIETIRQEGRHRPIPPFFWDASGRAAVHGSLTSAQKFLGASVLMNLAADPDSIIPMLNWITDANSVLVNHFAKTAGIENMEQIHVGECSGCMVGGGQFEELIVPQASRLGETVAAVRFHSCGKSDHLLTAFAKITNLGSLDLGGETSMALVRDTFRPDFPVSMAPPVMLLSGEDPEPVLDWAQRTFEENNGGTLTVVCHLEAQYNLEAIRALASKVSDMS